MKTTKELIIADITAKVEAKLASQKVELGLVDDIKSDVSANGKSADIARPLITQASTSLSKAYENLLNIKKQSYTSMEEVKAIIDDVNSPFKKRHQKILLNSLYGVLGLPAFRFYDVDNAEAVTTTGQTVIKSTADMANIKYNKELGTSGQDFNIYIDTDSVFFSAVPILDHRYKDWRNLPDAEIALKVDAIAGETQDFLNKFYDVLAEKVFNVDKTKHRFQIKKEFVSRSGIWIAKKRYAQWIIAENGIPTDRLDVKGLDVVRSSYPAEFRKFMSEILISILRGDGEMILTDRIYDFKKSLSTMNVVSIAKNSAVKEISKYIPKKKDNRAMFQFNSGTPAHVKAAIAHNQLLVHFKCAAKHAPMRDGDKIKWVYLKQNPFGLDAVGFKGHDDPDEIMDLVRTYIDYDKIFERELLKKLEDFYGALGWGAVLSSQKTAEQFFSF